MGDKTFNDKYRVEKQELSADRIKRKPTHPQDIHEGDLVKGLNLPEGKIRFTDITSVSQAEDSSGQG